MTIKHLVLPGGGAAGFRLIGALSELHEKGIWNNNDIESIHSISIGAIISALIAMKFEWQTIVDYVIKRPWDNAFQINLTNIFDVFNTKGFFGTEAFATFYKPFFDTMDISLDITLNDFFELTKVELYYYAVELNTYKLTEISYKTFPDLQLLKAIQMTASYPTLISPVIMNDKCYVDGGLLCNYPINYCCAMVENKDEILGFISSKKKTKQLVTSETSIFEYIMFIINKMVHNTKERLEEDNQIQVRYQVPVTINSITMSSIQECVINIDKRRELLDEGVESAKIFMQDTKNNDLCSRETNDTNDDDDNNQENKLDIADSNELAKKIGTRRSIYEEHAVLY